MALKLIDDIDGFASATAATTRRDGDDDAEQNCDSLAHYGLSLRFVVGRGSRGRSSASIRSDEPLAVWIAV